MTNAMYSPAFSYPGLALETAEDRRVPMVIPLLCAFIASALALNAIGGGLNYVIWALGIVCTFAFAVGSLQGGFSVPREVFLYGGFLLWATFGAPIARISAFYWTIYTTLFQFLVMLLVVSHYVWNARTLKILLLAFLLGALTVGASGYLSGEYQRSEDLTARTSGLAMNSNQFGMILTHASVILLFLFRVSRSLLVRAAVGFLLVAAAALIIASGSRGSFVAFIIQMIVWFTLVYAREWKRYPGQFLGGAVVLAAVGIALAAGFGGSALAKRFENLTKGGAVSYTRETSTQARIDLYFRGLEVIGSHPLFGVGAGNFIAYAPKMLYSHSNYIEVFTSVGIPGGLLYYGVMISLALRLRRLRRFYQADDRMLMVVRLAQTVLVVRLVNDFTRVTYTQKPDWILLALLIGWAHYADQRARAAYTGAYAGAA